MSSFHFFNTSTTLDAKDFLHYQKVIEDVILGEWRIWGIFDDQAFHYVLSVSLNIILILQENFRTR